MSGENRFAYLVGRQDLAYAGPTGSWAQRWIPGVCKHAEVRCTHGDEIIHRGWRRRACLVCGRALRGPLPVMCSFTEQPHLSGAAEGENDRSPRTPSGASTTTGVRRLPRGRATVAEAMQWPVAGLERALESWAYLIVAWVNANGGEARYEPEYVDHNGPQTPDRIALRRADGWTYVSPGQWVVMGEHGFEVVVDSADGTKYLCRDFYPSDFPPAAASCGSPDTLEATDLAAKRRERKSRDDGTCPTCGRHRVLCSPMGRECVYAEKKAPAVRGEFR